MLLIPGPVRTHPDVKAAFAQDYAPWDMSFREIHARLRDRLLVLAGGTPGRHTALALQGCGHFIVEAAIRTFVPAGGRMLIPDTGDYAEHMKRLALEAGRQVVTLEMGRNTALDPGEIEKVLASDPQISHLGLVSCETSTGICHDVAAAGRVASAHGRRTLIDALSAFGALPLDISAMPEADALIFTSNKCLEGMPGLGLVVSPVERLIEARGNAGSWSLDLSDVYAHSIAKPPGTWRFTPSAQAVAALSKALDIYDAEGGQPARLARYTANQMCLYQGLQALGLTPCLPLHMQGPIVVNVHAPPDPAWNLQLFVDALKRRGIIISNFYNTPTPSFRVGCIGQLTPDNMEYAVTMIGESLDEMGARVRSARGWEIA